MLDVVDYAQGGVGLGVVRDDAMCVLNILAAIATEFFLEKNE